MHQWLLTTVYVLLMMDAVNVRNMWSILALVNKKYCQSCIKLVPYIISIAVSNNNNNDNNKFRQPPFWITQRTEQTKKTTHIVNTSPLGIKLSTDDAVIPTQKFAQPLCWLYTHLWLRDWTIWKS